MQALLELTAYCRQELHALSSWQLDLPLALPMALFLAGLSGSLAHCVGMCGPFVLSQVVSDAEGARTKAYGEWQRLAGAALAPYHFGRLTTYTALGALAGALTALFTSTLGFAWLSGSLLVLAAGLMIAQAIGLSLGTPSPLSAVVARLATPLSTARSSAARYGLGLVLGLLPCGLVYGALAAAGGTGSASYGALAMAAFAFGTMPALVAVGWLGLVIRRRLGGVIVWLATPLLATNAALMLVLAAQRFAA
jgi:sulfite exporter TauE/SafE